MPPSTAKASGADPSSSSSSTRSRAQPEAAQGSHDRRCTAEQRSTVLRVRKCAPTAFYEILDVQKTASDSEVKKAYRKLSLMTHPDKNSSDGADEAFKMVSRAFQILSDSNKRAIYDKYGGDPESRTSTASPDSPFGNGFRGFARRPARGPMFDDEISPEELFNRFFGGGGGFTPFGGGGLFDSPQFVFNVGGGPNGSFRVHHFGGGVPGGGRTASTSSRRGVNPQNAETPDLKTTLLRLFPFLLFFLLPLISSWFGGQTPTTPTVRFESPMPPQTEHRVTPKLHVDYYVNPNDIADYTSRKLNQFDHRVEVQYVSKLQHNCESELLRRERLIQEAQGWFSSDTEKIKLARTMVLHNCKKLDELHLRRTPY